MAKITVCLLGPESRGKGEIWMDFVTKELPDTPIFRFGVTAPNEVRRNPDDPHKDHVIIVPHVNFAGDEWHHVVGIWKGLNGPDSTAVLNLHFYGKIVGSLEGFHHELYWNIEDWEIRAGLGFKGKIDEFFIMDRFLSAEEADTLYLSNMPMGVFLGLKNK